MYKLRMDISCNDEETANKFNNYFTSIGNDLAKKISMIFKYIQTH